MILRICGFCATALSAGWHNYVAMAITSMCHQCMIEDPQSLAPRLHKLAMQQCCLRVHEDEAGADTRIPVHMLAYLS